ncbi:hypothetical protein LZG04_41245 [Saccharothrix sp. S26]|uniref:hypothetical protein n=1 Tax=Saccharothrix sp. S26 TaxID=2907215 RepID=UPI001F488ACC|nr:hypothetical protein [Saccharothrix sp. S26]MCE7001203.1 hypothetical protein [Saccharothrix sp. S26]
MGAGQVHMDVDAVRRHMEQVADVGREVAATWAARGQELRSLEAGIGSGPIGAAIRAAYLPPAQAVADAVAKIPGLYTAMARAGRSSADDYERADRAGAGALAGAAGGPASGPIDPSRL